MGGKVYFLFGSRTLQQIMEIAEAVPYTIEGGKDIPYKIPEGETPISELFDLSYTDYHFFKEHFLEKRTYFLPSFWICIGSTFPERI